MKKKRLIEILARIPDDAEVKFSVDISGEFPNENNGARAFGELVYNDWVYDKPKNEVILLSKGKTNLSMMKSEKPDCLQCGDRGWIYDKQGKKVGICPCHY